ncbi:MAG: GNAT family N-acetyltransferase [Dehalococcoidia bacterium]|nr:GNAT family N-acetyltransferase [Dehalococcoidia bacterium]
MRTRSDLPELVTRSWLACRGEGELREKVAAHGEILTEYRGPAFILPTQTSFHPEVVPVTAATPLHPDLVARGWRHDEQAPYFGIIRDGTVVSVCYSSRLSAEAAAAGVETASDYRGQGLALEAVRAWGAAVQSTGRLAFYSTEWSNNASRGLAAKLAAFEFGEDWHLT